MKAASPRSLERPGVVDRVREALLLAGQVPADEPPIAEPRGCLGEAKVVGRIV